MAKLVDIFLKGGPVMWPILALSVLGLAVLVWKAFEFRAGRRSAKGLVVVSTIITAEPMLGILGTVVGIMQTFGALNGAEGARLQLHGSWRGFLSPASPLGHPLGIALGTGQHGRGQPRQEL